jgi:peptide/nickel transport system permease protein
MTDRKRLAGASLLLVVALFALFGPLLVEIDPNRQDLRATLAGPGADYWLGTDHLGRSLLSRLAHAARLSLGFGLLAVLGAALPGIVLGLAAAWRGGWLDRALSAFCDAVMALPPLLLVVLLVAFAPGDFAPLYLGLALSIWVEYFRVVRTIAATRLARPDIEAAKLLGFGPLHILRRHLLPDLAPPVATLMAYGLGTSVLAISTLSFIGVGLRPPQAEWGSMMTELMPYYAEAPLQLLMPAAMLFTTVLGLNLVAGSDPR